ncbi:PLP-dependent aminotransferase family protein [Aneurinibacillus aneurinilyticus]|uniref:aminotransferase-like domain-containing protein n=1 Tax=Aneurinibacillus aneurinilyticus TaxID=1391 RepID=UPI0023F575E0|nr:PLP-dependent aminotransferase family protein [Aneurinibacillus aneurinilyticus]
MSIPFLHIQRASRMPLSEQIETQIIRAIRTRRMKAGQALPTVRRLAASLGVSMETIQKAYSALKKEGWIESRPRYGTTVSHTLPDSLLMLSPKREEEREPFLARIKEYKKADGLIPVSGISLPPTDGEFMRAFRQAGEEAVEGMFAAGNPDPFGLLSLRSRIQGLLAARGCWTDIEDICMVNGTQQALWLLADQICKPGDAVAVPAMCYLPARDVFCDRGLRVISIPLGSEGMDIDTLEKICEKEKITALYAMPNAHYPTGASWSMSTKQAVLALAERFGFSIIEDEYFGELYYTPYPPSTLYGMAGEKGEVSVFYMSSFSTIVHPNLRLGYMVLPRTYRERLQQAKYLLDGTTAVLSQQLFLHVWDRVNFPVYMERKREELRQARNAAMDSLHRRLPAEYMFHTPDMGVCTWVYAPQNFDSLRFFDSCLKRGVYVLPGAAFAVEDPIPGFQVKFGSVAPAVLDEGLQCIAEVLLFNW